MMVQRWDPLRELRRMDETVNRLWRGFSSAPASGEDVNVESWHIPLDVLQRGDNIIVKASLPGVDPADIEVAVEENVLTIKGHTKASTEGEEQVYLMRERRTGSFHRSLRLPDTADTEKVQPYYDHGVLTVTVPKAEAKKARRLDVQVGAPDLVESK